MTEKIKHSIPKCFFEVGPYEVWAKKKNNDRKRSLIAIGVTMECARRFSWPMKEIRLNGKKV